MTAADVLARMVAPRAGSDGRAWLAAAHKELDRDRTAERLCLIFSKASGCIPKAPLDPDPEQMAAAEKTLAGWNPERWSLLEAARAVLLLEHREAGASGFAALVDECFKYADQSELVALYRALPLLPDPDSYLARAREGCRSNMAVAFEAMACDNPYPFTHFEEASWRQLLIKAVFIEAPLWRVYGLDHRLSEELALMALDLADERRSAGRPVQTQLWLCLGPHGGRRATDALVAELESPRAAARAAAALGLARAGRSDLVAGARAGERDRRTAATMELACQGRGEPELFAALAPAP